MYIFSLVKYISSVAIDMKYQLDFDNNISDQCIQRIQKKMIHFLCSKLEWPRE